MPRVGTGVDVHAYSDDVGRPMRLAGLDWPGQTGLAGHSDADAVAHAACDALFAAAGLGDLGAHFGTDRPEFAGASGPELLAEAGLDATGISAAVRKRWPQLQALQQAAAV